MKSAGKSIKGSTLVDVYECSVCGYRTFGEVCTNERCGTEKKLKWNERGKNK